tara:strand:- start:106 stop:438 length:333 start_codon:yes stop_codon:yes gene_type:complete
MAQNFRQQKTASIGTSDTAMGSGNLDSFDCIVGIRLANRHTQSITATVWLKNSSNDFYLVKDAPIPAGSSLELIDGGAKVVAISGDRLYVKSNTASSLDCIVSIVDAIST